MAMLEVIIVIVIIEAIFGPLFQEVRNEEVETTNRSIEGLCNKCKQAQTQRTKNAVD